MQPIRILLAHHQPIVRNHLRSLLEREPSFQVVAEAATGRETVVLAEYKQPDILLLEVALPDRKGTSVVRELTTKYDHCPVIFVTAQGEEDYIREAFKAGAKGYVAEGSAIVDLVRAIDVVLHHRWFLSPVLSRNLLDRSAPDKVSKDSLTEYQKQICCLFAAGYDKQEAAQLLDKEDSQVQADLQALLAALQRSSISELLRIPIEEINNGSNRPNRQQPISLENR